MVTASSSRSDVRGNVRGTSVGSLVDSHVDVSGDIDSVGVVDDVGLDDGVDGEDGRDAGLNGVGDLNVDLDTLVVGGELVEVTAGLGGSALQGVGGSVLACGLA